MVCVSIVDWVVIEHCSTSEWFDCVTVSLFVEIAFAILTSAWTSLQSDSDLLFLPFSNHYPYKWLWPNWKKCLSPFDLKTYNQCTFCNMLWIVSTLRTLLCRLLVHFNCNHFLLNIFLIKVLFEKRFCKQIFDFKIKLFLI